MTWKKSESCGKVPRNISDDNRETIFIDIDGVIVKHNYDPDIVPDEFIESTMKYLEENKDQYIVLTTSRKVQHLRKTILGIYNRIGRYPDRIIYNLPTGARTLINDFKAGETYKANAINLERDVGFFDD